MLSLFVQVTGKFWMLKTCIGAAVEVVDLVALTIIIDPSLHPALVAVLVWCTHKTHN